MDMESFLKGNFLTAKDVIENPDTVWIIASKPEFKENSFKNHRLHIPISSVEDEVVIFDSSKTNVKTIIEVLGQDESKWVGGRLVFETYKMPKDGKMIDAINVKLVKKIGEEQ